MLSMYYSLQELIQEYQSDTYMLARLETHITQLLPETLKTEAKKYQERQERKRRLTDEYALFIETFLLKHRYYYCQNSELFMEYNGEHFLGCSEDDILHKILSISIYCRHFIVSYLIGNKFHLNVFTMFCLGYCY